MFFEYIKKWKKDTSIKGNDNHKKAQTCFYGSAPSRCVGTQLVFTKLKFHHDEDQVRLCTRSSTLLTKKRDTDDMMMTVVVGSYCGDAQVGESFFFYHQTTMHGVSACYFYLKKNENVMMMIRLWMSEHTKMNICTRMKNERKAGSALCSLSKWQERERAFSFEKILS